MNVGKGKCDRSALRVIRALGPGAGGLGFFCSMKAAFDKENCKLKLRCLLAELQRKFLTFSLSSGSCSI